MQVTFTDYAVGGHQSRHISLNTGAVDTNRTRPEAWRLLFGRCDHEEDGTELHKGAIGYVGADYPILEHVEYGTYSSVDDIYPNNKGKPQPRAGSLSAHSEGSGCSKTLISSVLASFVGPQ